MNKWFAIFLIFTCFLDLAVSRDKLISGVSNSFSVKHDLNSSTVNTKPKLPEAQGEHRRDCSGTDECNHQCHFGHCAVLLDTIAQISATYFSKFTLSFKLVRLNQFSSNLFRPPIA